MPHSHHACTSTLLASMMLSTQAFLPSSPNGIVSVPCHNNPHHPPGPACPAKTKPSFQPLRNDYQSGEDNPNAWVSSTDSKDGSSSVDWQEELNRRNDGTLWSSFESSSEESTKKDGDANNNPTGEDFDDGEVWLDALAAISADEVTFMNKEADRADKVRQMQEWGFDSESISSTLGVNTDASNEKDPENTLLDQFQEETAKSGFGMYLDDDVDLELVESHTTVERDEETGEPIRTQMVYVDEHSCIGCYNCANVAQSTFFMESYMGRARVFQQWGDDQETIEIAIETCPVDCIHYVPYEELVKLEIERRDQNINFKARLVGNGGEAGRGTIGGSQYTPPQEISGNSAPRCNNCPSRGCKNCPMFGVGKNPYFEKREKERKEKLARKRLQQQMEDSSRKADL